MTTLTDAIRSELPESAEITENSDGELRIGETLFIEVTDANCGLANYIEIRLKGMLYGLGESDEIHTFYFHGYEMESYAVDRVVDIYESPEEYVEGGSA